MSATFDKQVCQKSEVPALLFSHSRSCILPYCHRLALQLFVYKYNNEYMYITKDINIELIRNWFHNIGVRIIPLAIQY